MCAYHYSIAQSQTPSVYVPFFSPPLSQHDRLFRDKQQELSHQNQHQRSILSCKKSFPCYRVIPAYMIEVPFHILITSFHLTATKWSQCIPISSLHNLPHLHRMIHAA